MRQDLSVKGARDTSIFYSSNADECNTATCNFADEGGIRESGMLKSIGRHVCNLKEEVVRIEAAGFVYSMADASKEKEAEKSPRKGQQPDHLVLV